MYSQSCIECGTLFDGIAMKELSNCPLCKIPFNQSKSNNQTTDWDSYFMDIAETVKMKSKDPSTKVGAVISKDNRILSTGYNGYPRGYDDNYDVSRETKLKLTIHAELNAILNAAKYGISVDGCTLYVTSLPPCSECAKAIVQAGITRVVCHTIPNGSKWKDSCELGRTILESCNVEVVYETTKESEP